MIVLCYEVAGMYREGKGFGFVYKKQEDGKWQRLADNKEK
jgi:hypothetical protein